MLTRTRTCTCACGRLRDYTGDGGEEEGQGRKKSEKSCFRRSREARGWRNHVLSVRGVCLSGSRGLLQTQAPRTGSGASAAPPQPSPAHTPHPHAPKGACHSLRAHLHLHHVLSIQDPELPSPNGPNPRPRVCGGPLPRSVDRVTGGTLLGQGWPRSSRPLGLRVELRRAIWVPTWHARPLGHDPRQRREEKGSVRSSLSRSGEGLR